jgi:hypothetical protein
MSQVMNVDREQAWKRTSRALDEMRRNVETGSAEEHFQTVGLLGREAIISVAQAVFDPLMHKRSDGKELSSTDGAGMLEAFFDSTLAASSNEEARKFAKSALALAVALQHRRTATAKDAALCEAAVEGVVRVVETVAGHRRNEPPWEGIQVGERFFAWAGPGLHGLQDRQPTIAPESLLHIIRTSTGMSVTFGNRSRLHKHLDEGKLQVYETDRKMWRRELVAADANQVVVIQRPA